MAITNTAKPGTSSYINVTKVNISELWSTMSSIWSAESRTWADTISTIDNSTRVSASITNTAKP